MGKSKVPNHLKDDFQEFVLAGIELGYTEKKLVDLVKVEYGINVSKSTINYQKPEIKNHVKAYRQRPEVKERKNDYRREYQKRPEVKERRKKQHIKNDKIIAIPYVVTEKGKNIINLCEASDGGSEFGTLSTIITILNEFPSTKYELLKDLKNIGFYKSGSNIDNSTQIGEIGQLKRLQSSLDYLEKMELIEQMEYFPDWLFGIETDDVKIKKEKDFFDIITECQEPEYPHTFSQLWKFVPYKDK